MLTSGVSLMNTQHPDRGALSDANTARHLVSVVRGNLYLTRETCDIYFPGIQSVALISREDKVMVMPLTQESGGGLLLKIRNVRGDRVIHAQEFFRAQGLVEDFQERTVPVHWSSELAALVIAGIPKTGHKV